MAFWDEEKTQYIYIDDDGKWHWTPFLEQCTVMKKPFYGKEPQLCFWLPVYIPETVSS
jgi:hypothetical protein